MRSPKSRSRSKSNRPRPLGNIVNRVFDSSGPEGKVRGTPQQIIDKYLVLARDAQLSNDRVAAENFLQHAEHYTRMLNEAQREMAREAEARRDGPRDAPREGMRDAPRDGARDAATREGGGPDHRSGAPAHRPRHDERDGRAEAPRREAEATAVIDFDEGDGGLVETPEARVPAAEPAPQQPAEEPSPRREGAREPKVTAEAQGETPAEGEKPAPRRRAPRRPRSGTRSEAAPEAKSSAAE